MISEIKNLYKEKESDYISELKDAYLYYTKNISPAYMAASLRTCAFLLCIYEVIKPNKILDLGSGFSSYSLRYFKNRHKLGTEICSVDSDKKWLTTSKSFCRSRLVSVGNFYHWNEIKSKNIPFELIFMDIDKTKRRIAYYDHVYKHFLSKKTFMLADDMHKPLIRNKIKSINIKHKRHRVFDETVDRRKRFSILIEF